MLQDPVIPPFPDYAAFEMERGTPRFENYEIYEVGRSACIVAFGPPRFTLVDYENPCDWQ